MSTYTNLLFRDEARAKLLKGATALADAVRSTLGPESHSVLLEKKWGSPIVCDDGVTIAKAVKLKDPEENLGAQMLRDAAVKTGDAVGDGTTTSTLLAHVMFAEGVRNVVAGASAVRLRRGMERGAAVAVEAISALSRPVKDRVDTAHVATVSAHNDETVGAMVAQAVDEVGAEGVVDVEQAKGIETTLEVVEGMQFDKGYLSPYFVTNAEKMEAVLDEPLIILVEQKITSMQSLVPLLESIIQQHRPIVMIAESIEGEALAALVVNRLRGTLSAVAVKAPGFGDRRKEMLQDMAVLTGGRVISEDLGDTLENVTIDGLGAAHRVVVTKDTTTIIDGAGAAEAVEGRRNELRRQIESTTSDWDREKLEERLAKLSGGVAIIKVGAPTEGELERLKEAYDDAISSTKAALAEGIVPGGGTALLRASDALEEEAGRCDGDERTGVLVVRRALEAPCRQLAENIGADPGVVVAQVQAETGFYGFDARSQTFGDLDDAGIIDPTKVVRIALQHAVSVAGTLLLAEATLTEVDDEASATPTEPPLL